MRWVMVLLIGSFSAHAHDDKEHAPKVELPKIDLPKVEHPQGDHEHVSPHGGIVATIDKETHVEVLFREKDFIVYFYDADMKPIGLPTDGKATVVVGKEVKKLDLPIAKKEDGSAADHLVGALAVPVAGKVVLQATLLAKARTARVERKAP